jgi:hypothetical protein
MRRGANSLLFLTLIAPGAQSQSLTLVHRNDCNRATLLSDVALLGKIAVLGKLAFLGKVAVLGKFTSWQSHHWRHHQHPAGVNAVAALSSSQTLPWRSCGPPFHGRQCPPLGPQPFFGVFPARLAPIQACAPSSSDSSESISSIALASAPAQTAVWPAIAADGASPLVFAFLADLWARSTPSGAGSSSSSETLPT